MVSVRRIIFLTAAWMVVSSTVTLRLLAQPKRPPLVPVKVKLNRAVQRAIDDELINAEQRTQLRLFHGQWDGLDDQTKNSPAMALARWDLNHPSLQDKKTPALLRAQGAYRSGHLSKTVELLKGNDSVLATVLRGKALADQGQYRQAIDTLDPVRKLLQGDGYKSAAEITAAAEAMILLAELEGRPADDFRFTMSALGRVHQRIDPFHWPAMVAEGRLLMNKANPSKAVEALHDAVALHPKNSEAYYELGQIAVTFYNFDQAEAAIQQLRTIHPKHILADVLQIELLLTQKDSPQADALLQKALKQYPTHRRLLALAAAVAAQKHDDKALAAALQRFEKTAGNHPLGLYLAGIYMSKDRQYGASERLLRAAIARQPNWPNPRVELGWVLHQAGKEGESLKALRAATQLDPFNQRAKNSLVMLEGLIKYKRIETEHFIIKYSHELEHEIDRVLAADMADQLDRMFEEVTAAFEYKPRAKTLLEIMPNKEWFAVRITGMPDIWTIGACTGPVIAITPPRIGKGQAGSYDWYRVIRHEFTHTVTLEMTGNRIPHWFTEACAVSQEPGPRDYNTCKLLADALMADELFTLENLTWGFVRPKKPTDRSLAYAQSHWIYEYITETYGHQTIIKMLKLAEMATPESQIIAKATGKSNVAFFTDFKAWGRKQIAAWGMAPKPSSEEIAKQIKAAGGDRQAKFDELFKAHPNHPDLLQLAASAALKAGDDRKAYELLHRYAEARPVDPWADRQIAALAIKLGQPNQAIGRLEQLDRIDQYTGQHAITLTQLYSQQKDWPNALNAVHRAITRQPYDATLRERAAKIALLNGNTKRALDHLQALAGLEPDRDVHYLRLAALHYRLRQFDQADAAAGKALKLNPKSPAKQFLKPGAR